MLNDRELLRTVYCAIDWAALYASAPEVTREEVDTLFLKLTEMLGGEADAVSECTAPAQPDASALATDEAVLYCDGASSGNPGPAGIGVVIESRDGIELAAWGRKIPDTTNNVAEYTALLEGLRRAAEMGVRGIEIRTDSQLMQRQLTGRYRVKSDVLKPLFRKALTELESFSRWTVTHIDRTANKKADALASRRAGSKKNRKKKKK